MNPAPKTALDFKSATLFALRAVLHSPETDAVVAALAQRMAEAGAFYEHEPVVLDALGLDRSPDWTALTAVLRSHALYPIGVLAEGGILDDALAAGLAPVEVSGTRPSVSQAEADKGTAASAASTSTQPPGKPAAKSSTGSKASAKKPDAAGAQTIVDAVGTETSQEALVIRHPLRSGQRIYARGGDLIVIGMVSQGAEVIADGNIHVYGPLRGKAMAGARGNTAAMILTTHLDAELLAIAGVYRVVEARLPDDLHKQPAIVQLDGDTLRIRPL